MLLSGIARLCRKGFKLFAEKDEYKIIFEDIIKLAPSTKTLMKDRGDFSVEDYSGCNLHFGVREHAMAAIANGMAVHGGLIPYVSNLLEAASIAGANTIQKFFNVTIPEIKNPLTYTVVLTTIAQFNIFGQPFMFSSGGPNESTYVMIMYIRQLAFGSGEPQAGLASAMAVIWIAPIVWTLVSSFKSEAEIATVGYKFLPIEWTFQNYIDIFRDKDNAPIISWFINSFVISGSQTVLVVIIASMSAYAYARLEFRGREAIFWILMATVMFPNIINLIPLYKICDVLNWVDNPLALIIPPIAGVYNIFLIRQFLLGDTKGI